MAGCEAPMNGDEMMPALPARDYDDPFYQTNEPECEICEMPGHTLQGCPQRDDT